MKSLLLFLTTYILYYPFNTQVRSWHSYDKMSLHFSQSKYQGPFHGLQDASWNASLSSLHPVLSLAHLALATVASLLDLETVTHSLGLRAFVLALSSTWNSLLSDLPMARMTVYPGLPERVPICAWYSSIYTHNLKSVPIRMMLYGHPTHGSEPHLFQVCSISTSHWGLSHTWLNIVALPQHI